MKMHSNYAVLLGCLLAGPVIAAELRTALIGAVNYDSNVYASETGEVSDVVLQGGAELELRGRPDGRLDYLLNYRGDYESFTEESNASAWEHRQRFRLRYDLDRRSRLTVQQRYRRISNLRFERDDIVAGDSGIDLSQNRYDRNDVAMSLEHDLSRRWTLSGSAAHQFVDFEQNEDRSDSQTVEFGLAARYRLSERQDVGFAIRYADQSFDAAPSRLGAESQYTTAAVLWVFRISERARLEFEGGPTWIDARQDPVSSARGTQFVGRSIAGDLFRANYAACAPGAGQTLPIAGRCRYDDSEAPPIAAVDLGSQQSYPLDFSDADLKDDDVEFFGRMALSVGVADWELVASYDRRQSAIGGESLATSLDALALSADYRPSSQRWQLYGELRLDSREALTNATTIDYTLVSGPGGAAVRNQAFLTAAGDAEERDAFSGLVGTRYAITDRFSASLEARYQSTERSTGFDDDRSSDTYVFQLAGRYDFAPRRF